MKAYTGSDACDNDCCPSQVTSTTSNCDTSYHGICITVQNGHLAPNECGRGELPISEDARQVLQLCGSPTEVWRIALKLDPEFYIGSKSAENAGAQPTKRRGLVRICVSNRDVADQKRLNIALSPALPTLHLSNVELFSPNVGSISCGIVTAVERTATRRRYLMVAGVKSTSRC